MKLEETERLKIFKKFGADDAQAQELLRYSRSGVTGQCDPGAINDEPFVDTWKIYCAEAEEKGAFNVLKEYLPQLSFPIEEGISATEEYKDATLRGIPGCKANGVTLVRPESLTLDLYKSAAGRIPVLFTECREDFITLVRAMAGRNEPVAIPASMNACMVKGFNNWDRIARRRAAWEADAGSGQQVFHFSMIKDQKELYQDKFIILSDGGYSGVPASAFGLPEAEWKRLSVIIRREHECAHYLTQRVFGVSRNNMFDEIIADYAGITKALGRFNAEWFLRFVGLEDYPEYRNGARLENYMGKPPLSDGAFDVLKKMVYQSAKNLEAQPFSKRLAETETIIRLYRLSLEEIAENIGLT
ncbi:MAG: hypothetical protein LBK69_08305 [Syntrophomonadaceae bacterium]|jgi:hypothetical protein|nr:hypothetical protein [Syntrophomonadaceae bacterium]